MSRAKLGTQLYGTWNMVIGVLLAVWFQPTWALVGWWIVLWLVLDLLVAEWT